MGVGAKWKVVSSAYKAFRERHYISQEQNEFSFIWDLKISSKVIHFVRRILIDRLPTKHNQIMKRNVIRDDDQNLLCPFCQLHEETCSHILFTCPMVDRIWKHCIVG